MDTILNMVSRARILIIDDSVTYADMILSILKSAGYQNIITTESAKEAYDILAVNKNGKSDAPVDLILMDIVMPEVNGIEALNTIKDVEALKNIPVIMLTASKEEKYHDQAFRLGATDFITKDFAKTELLARIRSVLTMKSEMDKNIKLTQELRQANNKLGKQTLVDELTGVANRRHFDMAIENEWKRARRRAEPLSLIIADIDCFKKYNDSYGHKRGDECLKEVADSLKAMARRPYDLVARYGGEEFMIILPRATIEAIRRIAKLARQGVKWLKIEYETVAASGFVTISIGAATFTPDDSLSYSDLIRAADIALNKAKGKGGNKTVIYNDYLLSPPPPLRTVQQDKL